MAAEAGALDGELGIALRAAAERRAEASAGVASGHAIDSEHPWLGLDSFTEETRAFFFGREQEVAELGRRVQRKLLTILFGQSGLGKTSILRAGIVPKLRPNGYCPVYVRIDYGAESPPPAEQIKQAIFRATRAQGEWTQAGAAVEGESLWEFLHHRDDVLRDAQGAVVVPLLIFDQFEEIFTLAQGDDHGRRRAAQFLEELADLVENRPPRALEARIDGDDSIPERFDFSRADYRILIALREDYLAHLEGVKSVMPSITQNRMRLARMTGPQALAAVVKPGGRLVSEEVAESIVRFVAGGSELPNAEVEPSLLSLICRELNNARIAQGRTEISVDLLAGSKETILAEFYERALADQPAAVRRFIEDEMLTDSGFRESLGEERVRKAFNAAGASPDALAKLVDRRLLRVEERLDLRRVELTHDVLCKVVAESRDLRHAREAKEAAERELAAQKAREHAARKALVRARQVAAACAVLAIGAIAGAAFGYYNMKRAQEAEALSEKTRQMAQIARGEAEKLIVYLLDDFQLELAPIGRLDIVAELAQRALAYYRELPAQLRTPETERNRALALVSYGAVLRMQAKADQAAPPLAEAVKILESLRGAGDTTELTTVGLAKAKETQSAAHANRLNLKESIRAANEALELLKPLLAVPQPSRAVLRRDGQIRVGLGWALLRNSDEGAIPMLERAQAVFRQLGATEMSDHAAAASYADAGVWLGEALLGRGQEAEGKRVLEETRVIAAKLLDARPGHGFAMRAHANASGFLGQNEQNNLRPGSALPVLLDSERGWEAAVKRDPTVASAWNNLAVAQSGVADVLFRLGRVEDGVRKRREVVQVAGKIRVDGFLAGNLAIWYAWLAEAEAELGNMDRVPAALDSSRKFDGLARQASKADDNNVMLFRELILAHQASVALASDRAGEALTQAKGVAERTHAIEADGRSQQDQKRRIESYARFSHGKAAYRLGDYATAATAFREGLEIRSGAIRRSLLDELVLNAYRVELAASLARAGRGREAQAVVLPVLAFHEKLAKERVDDVMQRAQWARALMVSALAMPGERAQRLAQASSVFDKMPAGVVRMRSFGQTRDEIAAERAKPR